MKSLTLFLLIPLLLVLNACAPPPSHSYRSHYDVNRAYQLQMGVIEHVRWVQIRNPSSGALGTIAGGVIGGIAGSTVGRGVGRSLATAIGATAGAAIGGGIDQQAHKGQGLEITVRLDNGSRMVVVQSAEPMFNVGERVRVLSGSQGQTRVSR